MLASSLKRRSAVYPVQGETPRTLARILDDDINLAIWQRQLPVHIVADVSWLVSAFDCLLGAKRIGLRLRALDKAMCLRFHVDHVPVRLITTYSGIGSQ